jgi:hypothetical protein
MRKFTSLLTIGLTALIILAGCSPSASTPAAEAKQPAEEQTGVTTVAATAAPTEAGVQEAIPADSPEAAVTAFLVAYQENPDGMTDHLSSAAKTALADGNAASLLGFGDGALEGFAIQAAAVNPDPPAAMVEVAIRAGGVDALRRFHLTKENDSWVIDSIELPEG